MASTVPGSSAQGAAPGPPGPAAAHGL